MRDEGTVKEKTDTVKRAQLTLIAVGIFLLAVGVFLSPDSLKAVGIMRRTLESDSEMVRRTALLEVYVVRILCSLIGIAALTLAAAWRRIASTHWVAATLLVEDRVTPRPTLTLNGQSGVSFTIMITCFVLGILYIAVGYQLFDRATLNLINDEDGILEQQSSLHLFALQRACCWSCPHANNKA